MLVLVPAVDTVHRSDMTLGIHHRLLGAATCRSMDSYLYIVFIYLYILLVYFLEFGRISHSPLGYKLDVCNLILRRCHLVNAYEVKAGTV